MKVFSLRFIDSDCLNCKATDATDSVWLTNQFAFQASHDEGAFPQSQTKPKHSKDLIGQIPATDSTKNVESPEPKFKFDDIWQISSLRFRNEFDATIW